MNQKEIQITSDIPEDVANSCKSERFEYIEQYRAFLNAVQTRVQLEAQDAENKRLSRFLPAESEEEAKAQFITE